MTENIDIIITTINGNKANINDLTHPELNAEWLKLKDEIQGLYISNEDAYNGWKGWRGVLLKLIGVNLPLIRGEYLFTTSNEKLKLKIMEYKKYDVV